VKVGELVKFKHDHAGTVFLVVKAAAHPHDFVGQPEEAYTYQKVWIYPDPSGARIIARTSDEYSYYYAHELEVVSEKR
tara:strand:- start:425 stop:658 length:234 start_codon:yes stop_codon:yes gene_type:complete